MSVYREPSGNRGLFCGILFMLNEVTPRTHSERSAFFVGKNMRTPYDPTWKKYEESLHSSNADEARKATEAFAEEREKELKNSKRARDWENSRKESLAKDKPIWRKNRDKAEMEQRTKAVRSLKKAGAFELNIMPSPGFVVVAVEEKEEQTESGIILANQKVADNTGIVLDIGGDTLLENGKTIASPCKKGDKILFKYGAGLEVVVKAQKCRFMQFSDVLGVFY